MRFRELWLALTLVATCVLLLVWLGSGGWPGAPHPCIALGDCYCEAPRAGLVAQPANTWSAVPGTLLHLWLAWHVGWIRRRGEPPLPLNPMGSTRFFPALYALIVVFPAATFFHASLTDWGGKVDIAQMYLFSDFWIAYNLTRLYDLSRARFLALYLAATALLLIPRLGFSALGIDIFVVLVGGVIFTELMIAFPKAFRWLGSRRELTVRHGWLWAALALYVPALAVWQLAGQSGTRFCDPQSLLQGHALWHVLTAINPVLIYFYFLKGDRTGLRDTEERLRRL